MTPQVTTFAVRRHVVGIERVDTYRWRVTVDGRRLASFCSESRARAAGRIEARRLEFVALDAAHAPAPRPSPR